MSCIKSIRIKTFKKRRLNKMSRQSAIALCRVSTQEQRIEGHSLERQQGNVKTCAAELGVTLKKIWSIDQSSRAGKNMKRKDISEMLEFCKKDKSVKYLIIDEVDRFMRSIGEFYYFEQRFEEIGVKTYYASQPSLNTGDSSSKIHKVLSILSAEMSNDERQRKTTGGMRARVTAGYYPFNTHRGYRKTLTPGLHEPDPESFEVYQRAFKSIARRASTPQESLEMINLWLTKNRLPKLKIDKFLSLLRDEYYAGVVKIEKWDIRCEAGLHSPMISSREYASIQQTISSRKKRAYHRMQFNPEFPLAKLLVCGECCDGSKLTGSFQSNGKGKRYPKYRCRGCGLQLRRDDVHSNVNVMLSKIQLSSSDIDLLMSSLETVWNENQVDHLKQLARANSRLAELNQTKEALILKTASSPVELQLDYDEAINKIKHQIAEANTEIDLLGDAQNDLIEFVQFCLKTLDNIASNWWELSPDKRRLCQQMIFPNGIFVYRDNKVGTDNMTTIYRLPRIKKDLRIDRKSLMVELEGIAPSSRT